MPPTGSGRLPLRKLIAGHRAPRAGRRRAAGGDPPTGRSRWGEILSSAAVILAGVIVVIGFAFVASRAMRPHSDPPNTTAPQAQAPPLGEVSAPATSPSQDPIPLPSPSSSAATKPRPAPSTSRPSPRPPTDSGSIVVTRGDVPSTVDLSAEGDRDWVHWGEQSTFSLERAKDGGFAILEGAPTAPRFRQALSPQQFTWTDGEPVDHTNGTTTGIRTCGTGNGFTLSAPAGDGTRTLRLYVGVLAGRGRLDARLSTGSATASISLEQRDGTFRTAVLTVRYRAPKSGKLNLRWTTEKAFSTDCGGVALQAATLD